VLPVAIAHHRRVGPSCCCAGLRLEPVAVLDVAGATIVTVLALAYGWLRAGARRRTALFLAGRHRRLLAVAAVAGPDRGARGPAAYALTPLSETIAGSTRWPADSRARLGGFHGRRGQGWPDRDSAVPYLPRRRQHGRIRDRGPGQGRRAGRDRAGPGPGGRGPGGRGPRAGSAGRQQADDRLPGGSQGPGDMARRGAGMSAAASIILATGGIPGMAMAGPGHRCGATLPSSSSTSSRARCTIADGGSGVRGGLGRREAAARSPRSRRGWSKLHGGACVRL